MQAQAFRPLIEARLARGGVAVSDDLVLALSEYLALLARWNQRINLTAFDLGCPNDAAIDRLIVEPLEAAPHLRVDDRLALDIGSGGGSPAIPLKLAAPWIRMVLVEARERKCAFLREAVRVLGLRDVEVETVQFDEACRLPAKLVGRVDVVTARAVRSDDEIWAGIELVVRRRGRVLWFGELGKTPKATNGLCWTSSVAPLPASGTSLVVLDRHPA